MELFKQCASCYNECTGEVAYQKGTFVAVRQHCTHCGYQQMWRSQPHIKDTPAGNILLSAAILFSGATPGKILQMLAHMRVASISNRTFYYHQSQYRMYIIITGSKAFEQLNDIMSSKHLLQDVSKLSPLKQTSSLESYHSVINHFAPKLLAFSYVGMQCR